MHIARVPLASCSLQNIIEIICHYHYSTFMVKSLSIFQHQLFVRIHENNFILTLIL